MTKFEKYVMSMLDKEDQTKVEASKMNYDEHLKQYAYHIDVEFDYGYEWEGPSWQFWSNDLDVLKKLFKKLGDDAANLLAGKAKNQPSLSYDIVLRTTDPARTDYVNHAKILNKDSYDYDFQKKTTELVYSVSL